ncbi:MAG: hypothetical protein Q7R33_04795 [Nitrosarchaeum sp.]|nr:hypothetical protein [Nitrosarchaeum sp.]
MDSATKILNDIAADLAFNGKINYGELRTKFGDRIDNLRMKRESDSSELLAIFCNSSQGLSVVTTQDLLTNQYSSAEKKFFDLVAEVKGWNSRFVWAKLVNKKTGLIFEEIYA